MDKAINHKFTKGIVEEKFRFPIPRSGYLETTGQHIRTYGQAVNWSGIRKQGFVSKTNFNKGEVRINHRRAEPVGGLRPRCPFRPGFPENSNFGHPRNPADYTEIISRLNQASKS